MLENLRFRFCFVSGFCFRCAITKPHTTATTNRNTHKHTYTHTNKHTVAHAKKLCKTGAWNIICLAFSLVPVPLCEHFCPALFALPQPNLPRPVQLSQEYTYFTDRRNTEAGQRLQVDRLSRLDTCQSRREVDLKNSNSLCKSARYAARNSLYLYKRKAENHTPGTKYTHIVQISDFGKVSSPFAWNLFCGSEVSRSYLTDLYSNCLL